MEVNKEIFCQLSKIDPFQGICEGVAAAEELDRDGEILDYTASKAAFQSWSDSQKVASGGKSLGNIRLQHNPSKPVGRLIDINVDDVKKQIRVIAKIEETEAKNLLQAGVLTGFSIGGGYARRTPLPGGIVKYVAGPIGEISVVDRPCVPSAVYSLVRADGSHELRKFAKDPGHDQGELYKRASELMNGGLQKSVVLSVLGITPGSWYVMQKQFDVRKQLDRENMIERRRQRLYRGAV
jgi:hypothetical protein